MRRAALEVLACPACRGPLRLEGESDEVENGNLACPTEGILYPVTNAIPRLVEAGRAGRVAALAHSYACVWQRDGWGALDSSYLLNLPYEDVSGRRASEWRVKARSLDALERLFARNRLRRVVDLGCGVGWLSYRLAQRGYDVYAIDVVLDDVLGLGAAGVYVRSGVFFERIWGELERPPLTASSVDAVVCNASLHYANDLPRALVEMKRLLRPGGLLVVMNSPVYNDPESAERALTDFRERLRRLGASEEVVSTYHHFTRDSLVRAISSEVGPVAEEPFDPGGGFRWSRRAKGAALRMELASFPLLYARRAG